MIAVLQVGGVEAGVSGAQAASARISDIIVTQASDDLLIFASLQGAFTKEIAESIINGVPTSFTYSLRLMRRRALRDTEVSSLTVKQAVSYDLLKDEFTFVREGGGARLARTTRRFAEVRRWMEELEEVHLPVKGALEKNAVYYVLIKAEIRSIRLVFPLNYLLFFLTFFNFDTPWARSAYFTVAW